MCSITETTSEGGREMFSQSRDYTWWVTLQVWLWSQYWAWSCWETSEKSHLFFFKPVSCRSMYQSTFCTSHGCKYTCGQPVIYHFTYSQFESSNSGSDTGEKIWNLIKDRKKCRGLGRWKPTVRIWQTHIPRILRVRQEIKRNKGRRLQLGIRTGAVVWRKSMVYYGVVFYFHWSVRSILSGPYKWTIRCSYQPTTKQASQLRCWKTQDVCPMMIRMSSL